MKPPLKLLIGLFLFLLVLLFVNNLRQSIFFRHKDRINIVFYGKESIFLSFGLTDKLNYLIRFSPDTKVSVPGGYGSYRLGGLAKLASLEKKPEIFKKAFSLATYAFVDGYFYPKKVEIYYKADKSQDDSFPSFFSSFTQSSSLNFIDRLYVSYFLAKLGKNQFKQLAPSDDFYTNYLGYFYEDVFRNEKKVVQILYNSDFKTAKSISQILQGEGIRVVDLTQNESSGSCKIEENEKKASITGLNLSIFFGCQWANGQTGSYDILLNLGGVERQWTI